LAVQFTSLNVSLVTFDVTAKAIVVKNCGGLDQYQNLLFVFSTRFTNLSQHHAMAFNTTPCLPTTISQVKFFFETQAATHSCPILHTYVIFLKNHILKILNLTLELISHSVQPGFQHQAMALNTTPCLPNIQVQFFFF
jgi:hypothetical protein